jgi:hypothetical protein
LTFNHHGWYLATTLAGGPCDDGGLRRRATLGIGLSVLIAACGPVGPGAPVGIDVIEVPVRNVGADPVTVSLTAPALLPPVQGATLSGGADTMLYLPSEGAWQLDIDGRALATESRLETWDGCPLSIDVMANGPMTFGCAR